MAQPTDYAKTTQFSEVSDDNLKVSLDTEFDDIETTLSETLANLALIQRDDTELANATVGIEQLKPDIRGEFENLSDIVSAVSSAEGYASNAADSATEASGYATSASASATAASNAASDAESAAAMFPSGTGHGEEYLRQKSDESGLEYVDLYAQAGEWSSVQVYADSNLVVASGAAPWNVGASPNADLVLSEDVTLSNPTNMTDWGIYILRIHQDATGGRTLSYGAAYKWPGGTVPDIGDGPNDVSILTFLSDGTNMFGVASADFA